MQDQAELGRVLMAVANGDPAAIQQLAQWGATKGLAPERLAQAIGPSSNVGGNSPFASMGVGALGTPAAAPTNKNPAVMPTPGSYPTPQSLPPAPPPQGPYGPPTGDRSGGDWQALMQGTPSNFTPGIGEMTGLPLAGGWSPPPSSVPSPVGPIAVAQGARDMSSIAPAAPPAPTLTNILPQPAAKAQGAVPATAGALGSNVPAGPGQVDINATNLPPVAFDTSTPFVGGSMAGAAFNPVVPAATPAAPLSAAPSDIGMSNIAPVGSNWTDLATAEAVAPTTAIAAPTDWAKMASGLEGIEPPANPNVPTPSTPGLPSRNALPTNLLIPALLAAVQSRRAAPMKLS